MAAARTLVELPGSAPKVLRGSVPRDTRLDAGERISVLVVVRSQAGDEELAEAVGALSRQLPQERLLSSREEHERRFGSSARDLAAIQSFAEEHGLLVVAASAARRVVELSGTLGDLSRAFGVSLRAHQAATRGFRSHDGPLLVPKELKEVIEDVIGLDDRPLLRPHAASGGVSSLAYTDPRKIAGFYKFPPEASGKGQCVAILQFGGGYLQSDMETYFRLRGLPVPAMSVVELGGQTNQPADQQTMLEGAVALGSIAPPAGAAAPSASPSPEFWATLECTMDPQLVGTFAPGAKLVTYFAPDTAQGKYLAFSTAIFDQGNAPKVINCSWGSCENQTPTSTMRSLDRLLQQAALQGVTICASSGDFGDGAATCGEKTGHFPATSPHALACGGTSVASDLSRETTWNETVSGVTMCGGGGFSQVFDLPAWQKEAGVGSGQTMRGFPDVAAKADLGTGYDVLVTGLDLPMGGTSAAAPLWSGLAALLNERLGQPVGLLGPLLYAPSFATALRSITLSGGGTCLPTSGWDACTGLGTPLGTKLLAALMSRG